MGNQPARIADHVPIRQQPPETRRMSLWFWGVTLGIAGLIVFLGLAMLIYRSIVK